MRGFAPWRGNRGDVAQWALLSNGLGKCQDALVAAPQASEHPQKLRAANWGLTELVGAAARSGVSELAADALSGSPR